MNYRVIKEYMHLCEIYKWNPTFKGLNAYKRILKVREKWINNRFHEET